MRIIGKSARCSIGSIIILLLTWDRKSVSLYVIELVSIVINIALLPQEDGPRQATRSVVTQHATIIESNSRVGPLKHVPMYVVNPTTLAETSLFVNLPPGLGRMNPERSKSMRGQII